MFSPSHLLASHCWQSQRPTLFPPCGATAGVVGAGGLFFHDSTVDSNVTKANPSTVVGVPNPWERLALWRVLPSVFAQDPHFTREKQKTNNSEKNALDLGVLSPSGEAGYLQRVAVRKNNISLGKRHAERQGVRDIPQDLRSRGAA